MAWRDVVAKVLNVQPKIEEKFIYINRDVPGPVEYRIAEVEAPRTPVGWDKDMRETIATLSAHPGFVALLDRLKLQAGYLKAQLINREHKEMKDVIFLQSGIYWAGWLQQQIASATKRTVQSYKDAEAEDKQALAELNAMIERVE